MARSKLLSTCARVTALSLAATALLSTSSWATTQEIGPMQVFKVNIPMFNLQNVQAPAKTAEAPAKKVQVPSLLFDRRENVSDAFVAEIEQASQKLPANAMEALAKKGYKITLSHTVTEAVPGAKNQQVRGYQPSSTWNSVFGMFNRSTKRVVMAEKAEPSDKSNKTLITLNDKARREGILRHEFGHAVDHYLGNFSHTTEFVDAYKKGMASISEPEKEVLFYYLQPGYAGIEETFAELFACLHEDACDHDSDTLLKNHFPELVKLIRNKVATIKA